MKTQASARHLSRTWQTLLAQRLSGWTKHRTYGLYRRTEDFVQWVVLDPSIYDSTLRIHYAVQTLAEQFPTEALTLGDIVRNSQGGELRLSAELPVQDTEQILAAIVGQIAPSVAIPFSAEHVAQFLDTHQFVHGSAILARGVAAVILGDTESGRNLLKAAFDQYHQMPPIWARALADRIHTWLETEDERMLNQVRRDALVGAKLLHLK